MQVKAAIEAARMIPFRARDPMNDLVEVRANSFGSIVTGGVTPPWNHEDQAADMSDLLRGIMSGRMITQEKTATLGLATGDESGKNVG